MTRLKLVAAEAVRSASANLSTTLAATVTVLIAMFLMGTLIAFATYARSWSSGEKEQLVVKAFFCVPATCDGKEATRTQIDAFAGRLQSNPLVGSYTFKSKEEALKEQQRKYPDLYSVLASNPLPDAFEVKPVRGEDTEALAASLYPAAGVQKICPKPSDAKGYTSKECGGTATRKILDAAHVIESFSLFGVILLLIAATLLIANTIRLSLFSRRREIEVMKLVGASNWFVRGPFVIEGLICGLIGSVLAVILLIFGKELVLGSRWFHDPDVHALPFALNALILVGFGLALGAAGSGLTLRRFLRV